MCMPRYAVVFESGSNNWSSYSPDLPGCVSTGKTLEDCKVNMREAIELHLEGMRADNEEIPEGHPGAAAIDFVEVA